MANAVGMKPIYDYFYRVTSDTVHFNPGVALRNGWGKELFKGKFATKNFCRYYLFSSQIYSVFLFSKHCETLTDDLALTAAFLKDLKSIRVGNRYDHPLAGGHHIRGDESRAA